MALSFHLLYPQIHPQPRKFRTHPSLSTTHLRTAFKPQISCTKSTNGGDLTSDLALALEVEKINAHLVQRQDAMKKSKQLLFAELCKFLGVKREELEKKWKKMEEEDRWVLVKGFVLEWGVDFHPLSERSVKEMVEEHLVEDDDDEEEEHQSSSQSSSFPSILFDELKKFVGFPSNN
ncbi:hypothetical protein U1Q18_035245 [Sarracenia purpurea var. burkii]